MASYYPSSDGGYTVRWREPGRGQTRKQRSAKSKTRPKRSGSRHRSRPTFHARPIRRGGPTLRCSMSGLRTVSPLSGLAAADREEERFPLPQPHRSVLRRHTQNKESLQN